MKKTKIKKNPEAKERILTIKIKESEIERLDYFCKKVGINRSQLTRNIIGVGLDDLELLNSVGFLALTLKGIDIFDAIKSSLKKKNYVVENEKLIIDL